MHSWLRCQLYVYLIILLSACSNLPKINAPPTITGKSTSVVSAMQETVRDNPLIQGNKVTLLFDGPETMTAMLTAIKHAKKSINFETYIFDQDQLGSNFANALIEKQRAGVQVSIIYDSVGSIATPAEFFTHMRNAGIKLLEFNPVNPLKRIGRWQVNHRDHRKILVVDGKIGFAGGVNISAAYANSSLFRSKHRHLFRSIGWRDTHLQIEGPAVSALQTLFLQTWHAQHGAPLPDHGYFPPLTSVGDKAIHVLGSQADGNHNLYLAYILAIQYARQSIHITTPYFSPDPQLLNALIRAAQRGIDVRMILPSISDNSLVFQAGRSFYDTLLSAGVRIYELQQAVLHAKTAVIDGIWSTVGSANLDMRSFLHNDEINIIVIDYEFGNEMEKAFQEDQQDSQEIQLDQWRKRPFSEQFKEWVARSLGYWL